MEYNPDRDPVVNPEFQELLIKYSNIPEGQVLAHIKTIRNEAWNIRPYPCIAATYFQTSNLALNPHYKDILARLKQGQDFLDLGYCLGQDLRRLAQDGAPSASLQGHDLNHEFANLSYELFNDRGRFKAVFTSGDVLTGSLPVQLRRAEPFDIIHASDFIHIFSRDEQILAIKRVLSILRKKSGSLFLGRFVSVEEPHVLYHSAANSKEIQMHNPQSFRELIEEVRHGIEWPIRVEVEEFSDE